MAWEEEDERRRKAHAVFIRLVLPAYTLHFSCATYMREATLTLLDGRVCKTTLAASAREAGVRAAIGADGRFWAELVGLLRAAVPSVERRSFTIWDPSSVDYDSPSGALIAQHHPGLWRDLDRLTDLLAIARNALASGPRAQDTAAAARLDHELFRLVNAAVRVTARGYDGDAGTPDEEKWQAIVAAYKKCLITCLQALNNLVARNEPRKLMLWLHLFDHRADPADPSNPARHSNDPDAPPPPVVSAEDILIAYGTNGHETLDLTDARVCTDDESVEVPPLPDDIRDEIAAGRFTGNGYVFALHKLRQSIAINFNARHAREPTRAEMHLELRRRWHADYDDDTRDSWTRWYETQEKQHRADVAAWETKEMLRTTLAAQSAPADGSAVAGAVQPTDGELAERMKNGFLPVYTTPLTSYAVDGGIPAVSSSNSGLGTSDAATEAGKSENRTVADDMKMLFTADAGARILESGKAELLKRLEGYPPPRVSSDPSLATLPVRTVSSDPAINPAERIRSRSRSPLNGPPARITPQFRKDSSLPGQVTDGHALAQLDHTQAPEGDQEDDGSDESDGSEEDEDDEDDDQEDEEEDYPGSTEDGRGLLTDVPLILGPSEIEVLPMLIMSGIVPNETTPSSPTGDSPEQNAVTNMHTVRTHLLLSQSNGRNLLRELLIFVAAWDLREEELYFKFMVKIMEAILLNGLMPYAYHAFRDRSRSKDIISPAQAVIMKLLTCIFRGRSEGEKKKAQTAGQRKQEGDRRAAAPSLPPAAGDEREAKREAPSPSPPPPSRVDLHILNFIFTEFRQHIIPQTCALIFLQGQIHSGRASPEDFPLNLWDMERMYEGVYQYLEFFAVLTEEPAWKGILGEWEMASELVTLLRELEGGVSPPTRPTATAGAGDDGSGQGRSVLPPVPTQQRSLSADAALSGSQVATLATSGEFAMAKRPDDDDNAVLARSNSTLPPLPLQPTPQQHHPQRGGQPQIFEPETPLAYPEDPIIPPLTPHHHHLNNLHTHSDLSIPLPPSVGPPPQPPSLPSAAAAVDQDEPSDFEWRNLKKLTVLVLSSLVWKNRSVQDQIRKYGGLEVLVSCCRSDEHNPHIREHAIMCLRFAVDGCEENAEVIKSMAASGRLLGQTAGGGRGGGSKLTASLDGGSVTIPNTSSSSSTAKSAGLLPTNLIIPGVHTAENIPAEIFASTGYDTFTDDRGQAGLRRKDDGQASTTPATWLGKGFDENKALAAQMLTAIQQQQSQPSSYSSSSSSSTAPLPSRSPKLHPSKLTAEKAAELMQNAIRDLPLGEKLMTDHQKAEALAKLDRAFESTEKLLGKKTGGDGGEGA